MPDAQKHSSKVFWWNSARRWSESADGEELAIGGPRSGNGPAPASGRRDGGPPRSAGAFVAGRVSRRPMSWLSAAELRNMSRTARLRRLGEQPGPDVVGDRLQPGVVDPLPVVPGHRR